MASIGLIPLPEPGHINATRALSAELAALGHRVTYLTPPGQSHLFAERCLPSTPIHQRIATPRAEAADPSPWVFECEGGRPDLLLVDSIMPAVTIMAWRSGHRVVQFTSTYARRYDADLPPITSPLGPYESRANQARVRAAWQAEHQRPLHRQQTRLLRRQAEAAGLPLDWLDERAALCAAVLAPELILAPEELDFPRATTSPGFYAGPCVDVDRPEPLGALPVVEAPQPLIYCSLGLQAKRYPAVQQLLNTLAQTARLLPEMPFVVASDVAFAGQFPPNVQTLRNAPQLALLRRAAVMISHGGLNSIREAVYLGVPILVLPIDMDQPGNAARVAYHRVGVTTNWCTATPRQLATQLQAMLQDDALKLRVGSLASRLRARRSEGQAAASLAACLRSELATAWFRCEPAGHRGQGLATLEAIASTRPSASGRVESA
jgi:zeaxanthin glucosyltransferase